MTACLADSIVRCGGDLEEARDCFARACESSSGATDAMLHAAYADFLMDVFGDSAAAAAMYANAAVLVKGREHVDVLVSGHTYVDSVRDAVFVILLFSPTPIGELRDLFVRCCAGC